MKRPEVAPTITADPHCRSGETVERHPSYGMIGASRVNGGTFLNGSDFEHHGWIKIRISHGSVKRGLSQDWPYAEREIIEVSLSEAQWATFVSSLNCGTGVQCTLDHVNGTMMPRVARVVDRRAQFKAEMDDTAADALTALHALRDAIGGLKVSEAQKKSLAGYVDKAIQELTANVAFVAQSFDEHVEHNIERAKTEVHAYVQRVVAQAGLSALAGGSLIDMIGPGDAIDGQLASASSPKGEKERG